MDSRHQRYWISYDIYSDQLRTRVSQYLSGWGVRVQFSAFECVLSRLEIRKLQAHLSKLVKCDAGEVVILQCAAPGHPTHPLLGQATDQRRDYWVK